MVTEAAGIYFDYSKNLVTDETQARLDAEPNIRAILCGDMEPLIGNANLEFGRARPRGTPMAVQAARRVGRNDPCLVALGRSTSAAAAYLSACERVEGVEFDAAHCDERFVLHAIRST